jgi:hypothetical protein
MRLFKPSHIACCIGVIICVGTARVNAVNDNNSECVPAGGCWAACKSSGDGTSGNTIGASQSTECSPEAMSSCSGSQEAVCGVTYAYSSSNCDPTTITNSHYAYSVICGG